MRASVSRERSFGVVPLETSAWKPEIAPHAIVMKQNGKIFPPKIGPVPSENFVIAGSCRAGRTSRIPAASAKTVPSLTKVER